MGDGSGTKVAFLGLGVMGFPMAGHLASAGHEVTVYNRTAAKASQWTETYQGRAAATPAAAAQGAEMVFACVGADDDLRAVVYGEDGALAGMAEGTIFIDHTNRFRRRRPRGLCRSQGAGRGLPRRAGLGRARQAPRTAC